MNIRIIFQQQGMDVQERDQFFAIDGESWSPGLYLLMIQDNSGAIITKKLLKQ